MKIEDIVTGEKYKANYSGVIITAEIIKDPYVNGYHVADLEIYYDNSIHQKALHHYGAKSQINMLIEEMAELMQAISKERRCLEHNIPEEIADVQIVLDQIKLLYPEWKTWEQIKLKRLEEGL